MRPGRKRQVGEMSGTNKASAGHANGSGAGAFAAPRRTSRPFAARMAAAMLVVGLSAAMAPAVMAQGEGSSIDESGIARSETVKRGVDSWSAADYEAAVAIWQGPADAGDADAQFNLGQAYRLGRGVTADMALAERYYAQAAAQGHIQAADNYGLLMFQDGRREAALPYVQAAADRGDPRAQYLLGVAHFNGDLVSRDWVRAYALLTNATAAGLPQATSAIAQMDSYIPLEQRQQAQLLAEQLRSASDSQRNVQFAAIDLALGQRQVEGQARAAPVAPVRAAVAPSAPDIADARRAVALAAEAAGARDPAQAGADAGGGAAYPTPVEVLLTDDLSTVPVRDIPPTAPAPVLTVPDFAAAAPAAPPAAETPGDGPWRVQLGAFAVDGSAERLWDRLASRPELAGTTRILVPAGRITRLQAGGFATQAEAAAACATLKRAGQDCLVTR